MITMCMLMWWSIFLSQALIDKLSWETHHAVPDQTYIMQTWTWSRPTCCQDRLLGCAAVFQHSRSTSGRSGPRWKTHAAGLSLTLCPSFQIRHVLETSHGCSAHQATAAEAAVHTAMMASVLEYIFVSGFS